MSDDWTTEPPAEIARIAGEWPASDPRQHQSLWIGRPGGVVVASSHESWVPVVRWRRVIRPLVRGPVIRFPVIVPVGSSVAGRRDSASASLLLDGLLQSVDQFGARGVLLDEVAPTDALATAAAQLPANGSWAAKWMRPLPRAWRLTLPADRAAYWTKWSSKSRATLFRKARKISGELTVHRSPDEAEIWLAAAAKVSAASWQHEQLGTRITADERSRERRRRLAAIGGFLGAIQWHEGEPIAFIECTRLPAELFYEEGGFDQRHAALSPGTVLWVNFLTWLIESAPDVATVDFGFGDAPFKEQFGTESINRGHMLVYRRRSLDAVGIALDRILHRGILAVRERLRKRG